MKTTISTLMIILLTITAWAGTDTPPTSPVMEEEAYIDDIPFNTAEVVNELGTELAAEDYVDDIPFNTLDVILLENICMLPESEVNDTEFDNRSVLASHGLVLEDEEYVNDIPFNTMDVLALQDIDMMDEEYVDDIPFDTECVAQSVLNKSDKWARCMLPHDGSTRVNVSSELYQAHASIFITF